MPAAPSRWVLTCTDCFTRPYVDSTGRAEDEARSRLTPSVSSRPGMMKVMGFALAGLTHALLSRYGSDRTLHGLCPREDEPESAAIQVGKLGRANAAHLS